MHKKIRKSIYFGVFFLEYFNSFPDNEQVLENNFGSNVVGTLKT